MLTKPEVRGALESAIAEDAPHLIPVHVLDSLSVGLTQSRDLLRARVYEDVKAHNTVDSMVVALSSGDEDRRLRRARIEIEIYAMVVAADEIVQSHHMSRDASWLIDQLLQLRLASKYMDAAASRVDLYRDLSAEDRRLRFQALLQNAVPESAKAPLVMFRLFPRSVRIIAAVAFGDPLRAQELRGQQTALLPAIGDCYECSGTVLDNEDICPVCENPVWKFDWLQEE